MEEVNLKNCICEKEEIYFVIMLIISLLVYMLLIISIVGLFYGIIIALFLFFGQGLAIGYIKQNAVKITKEQFGDIYDKIKTYSDKLGLEEAPNVYVMQEGGLLNAFATRFLFKDIVVIYADILEMAYEEGENAVNFVIAHEMAHIKRKHLSKIPLIVCGRIIPFLGNAYSRACETTCDKIAMAITEQLPIDGLLVLAAGKKLYKKVDAKLFAENASKEKGFWGWFAEITSTHPSLATRVKNLTGNN